jgi:hypothetical protein
LGKESAMTGLMNGRRRLELRLCRVLAAAFVVAGAAWQAAADPVITAVHIVQNTGGADTWSTATTPGAVANNATVKLRVVVEVTGAPHTYYWGYAQKTITGLTSDAYPWDAAWTAPTFQWEKIMPKMDPSAGNHNDPWNTTYGHYTNVVANDNANTANCPHGKAYDNPGEPTNLGTLWGSITCNDPTHTCTSTKYLGIQARTNEGNGCAIIEYDHTNLTGNWEITVDTNVGVTHYTVRVTCGTVQAHALGQRESSTVSKLIYDTASAERAYNRGVRDGVMRIVRKSTHASDYIKHVEAYARAPWIYGSYNWQARDYIGFDCADLIQAAAYRAGLDTAYHNSANSIKNTHTAIGAADEPYTLVGGVLKKSDGTNASITIGAGGISVGDLVMIDWDGNGTADHTTALHTASGSLDGADTLVFAGHGGVTTKTLTQELTATAKIYLRAGW